MMYKCLNNINPTVEDLRLWAYDEDAIFTDQDEDLILYRRQYVPILMELASDPDCPKGYYCLTILTSYCQGELARRRLQAIKEIEMLIIGFNGTGNVELGKWKADFLTFSELAIHPRPVSKPEADALAFFLLVGPHRILNFNKISESKSGFLQYIASNDSYREYCYVSEETGFWEVSKSEFKEADARWF